MTMLSLLKRCTAVLALILGLHQSPAFAENTEKPGYSVDGRTSASVLSAKRSHSVKKEDEVGLAVFSGLIVIGAIGFFSSLWLDRK